MKKTILIIIAVAAVIALLAWALVKPALEVETGKVSQGQFIRLVQEDGKTRLRERFTISTPLTGQLARIALQQGDAVEKESVLATLRPVKPDLLNERYRLEQIERAGAMEAGLARSLTQVEKAQAALQQAKVDLQRTETLARQGFLSPTQNETERLNLRLREKELESARLEAEAARHQLDQARIAIRHYASGSAETSQRTWQIRSPITGKVLKVHQQSEGMVAAGTPLMELGDPRRLEVIVDLLTEDAAQISAGTQAELSNWGGPETLKATVRLVEPSAFTKVSALGVEEQRVHVVLDITSEPKQWVNLSDGYKVDVSLVVQTVDNALKVPVSALFPIGTRSAVFTIDNGKASLHEVEVLARNRNEAMIKSELKVGTQLIIYPSNKLKAGDRVKPLTVQQAR